MIPTPQELVYMILDRPRACKAIACRETHEALDTLGITFHTPVCICCLVSDPPSGKWHQATYDYAIGRCIRLCWDDHHEPIQGAGDLWAVYSMDSGQSVTKSYPSPLEAMLEYLEYREEPE